MFLLYINLKKVFFNLSTVVLMLFLLTGCGSQSLQEFREEGKGITRSLIQEFQSIHTREELLSASSRIEKLFNDLVDVSIAAQQFKEKNPQTEVLDLSKEDHDLSDDLRMELNRLYHIDGGREFIEKKQEQALQRLDAFEKRKKR